MHRNRETTHRGLLSAHLLRNSGFWGRPVGPCAPCPAGWQPARGAAPAAPRRNLCPAPGERTRLRTTRTGRQHRGPPGTARDVSVWGGTAGDGSPAGGGGGRQHLRGCQTWPAQRRSGVLTAGPAPAFRGSVERGMMCRPGGRHTGKHARHREAVQKRHTIHGDVQADLQPASPKFWGKMPGSLPGHPLSHALPCKAMVSRNRRTAFTRLQGHVGSPDRGWGWGRGVSTAPLPRF